MSVASAAPNALTLLSIVYRYFDLVSMEVKDSATRTQIRKILERVCSDAAQAAEPTPLRSLSAEERVADVVLRAVLRLVVVQPGSGALLLQVLDEYRADAHR